MHLKKFILFLYVAASVAMAQPLQVTVSADRTSLAVNEQLVLTVGLTGDGANSVGQITLPDVGEYLALLGSGGSSQSIQIVNGSMSVQKSFTYFYQAVKEGTVTIPAISVNYKGNNYSSSPVVIQIGRSSAPAAGGAATSPSLAPADASDEDLFIRAAVNKRTVYPNEPVIVTFRIYTRVNVASYGINKLPDTGGFWAEDFTQQGQQPQTRQEVINGRKYVVADIKKMALFPTSPGSKAIGAMMLDCDVRMQSRRRSNDIFDNFFEDPFFGRTVRRSVSSKPITIDVMPFPEENRPANFSGLSGQFRLSANVDKQDVKTNEAITLKVAISGDGNIRTIPKPVVQLPADFEQYEPKINESIQRQGDVVSGGKTFEYVLVPRFPGQQRIRPIQFSYFDASARQFRILSTPEIAIKVEKGSGDVATVPSGLSKEEVRFIGQDIRFIKMQSPRWRRAGYAFYRSGWFLALTFFPLLALAGAFAHRRHLDKLSGNIAYARSRGANRMAMKRLAKAAQLCQEKTQKEFYAEVSRALTGFAADKLNVAQAGIISSELEKRLRAHGLTEEHLRNYLELLQTCDFQRFAPANESQGEMDAFLKKAKEAIINLEKSI
jgi:hypothetical protein